MAKSKKDPIFSKFDALEKATNAVNEYYETIELCAVNKIIDFHTNVGVEKSIINIAIDSIIPTGRGCLVFYKIEFIDHDIPDMMMFLTIEELKMDSKEFIKTL